MGFPLSSVDFLQSNVSFPLSNVSFLLPNVSFPLSNVDFLLSYISFSLHEAFPIIGQTLGNLLLSCIFSLFCHSKSLKLDEMNAGSLSSSIVLLLSGGS